MVRESPETGNLSKMVAKLTGNRDLRFSDLATTAKITKIVGDAWRCLETSWMALRCCYPTLRHLGHQLGSIRKVWDHFDLSFTPVEPFLEDGAGSEIDL